MTKNHKKIEKFCAGFGYTKLPDDLPLICYVLQHLRNRGGFDPQGPLIAFGKECLLQNFYEGVTPPDVEKMLREFRPLFRNARTLSTMLSKDQIESDSEFMQFLLGKHDAARKQLEQRLKEDPKDLDTITMLANVCLLLNEPMRAKELAPALIAVSTAADSSQERVFRVYELMGQIEKACLISRMQFSIMKNASALTPPIDRSLRV